MIGPNFPQAFMVKGMRGRRFRPEYLEGTSIKIPRTLMEAARLAALSRFDNNFSAYIEDLIRVDLGMPEVSPVTVVSVKITAAPRLVHSYVRPIRRNELANACPLCGANGLTRSHGEATYEEHRAKCGRYCNAGELPADFDELARRRPIHMGIACAACRQQA
jgi:hypothetical protein